MTPSPRALRLVGRPAARAPAPPFGLHAFTEAPDADLAVVLDVAADAPLRAQVDEARTQIPDAAELPPGRLVVVLAAPAGGQPLLRRLFGARAAIPRAVRATALLARGYTNLGAGIDASSGADLVWGEVPATRSS